MINTYSKYLSIPSLLAYMYSKAAFLSSRVE
jgi:hypothetical protein